MFLENLFVSQETGMRMKAAGWTKPTAFVWQKNLLNGDIQKYGSYRIEPFKASLFSPDEDFFAPAAEEILRELPKAVKKRPFLVVTRSEYTDEWFVEYRDFFNDAKSRFISESLSEAAAATWL